MRTWLVLITAGGLGFAGCASGDDDDASTAVDCKTDKTTYDDVALFDKCVMCHSSELMGAAARHQAPANINFDMSDLASAIAKTAVPEVKAGQMPPPASGISVTEAEKQKFYAWVECGSKP
jgi:uncharacterized membrane protein